MLQCLGEGSKKMSMKRLKAMYGDHQLWRVKIQQQNSNWECGSLQVVLILGVEVECKSRSRSR
jgi:hypothetical protein